VVLQEALGLTLKIESGLYTKLRHLSRRRRPNAVKLSHRQRLDERRPRLRRDHEKPVRLAVIGGEFREEFVVGDAG
jgi:hypothetical protein